MPAKIDLSKHGFGRWRVLKVVGKAASSNDYLYSVICECGATKVVRASNLRNGSSKSCGCLQKEGTTRRFTKHGEGAHRNRTSEYRAWLAIHKRCLNPKDRKYPRYGGRGIKVCEQWSSYDKFLSDMGRKPGPEYSIDRIDNDGNYEPGNCRWATPTEQARNTSRTIKIEHDGKTLTLVQWAKEVGLTYRALYHRIKIANWPIPLALTS